MAYNANHDVRHGSAIGEAGASASDLAGQALSSVEGAAETVTRSGREMAGNAQAVAGNFRSAVDKSVREQPMTTLLMAAAVGFLIGALWKS